MAPEHGLGLISRDLHLTSVAREVATQRGVWCNTAPDLASLGPCRLLVVDAATVDATSLQAPHDVIVLGPPHPRALISVPPPFKATETFGVLCDCVTALAVPLEDALGDAAVAPGSEAEAFQHMRRVVARAGMTFDRMLQAAKDQDYLEVIRHSRELSPHFGAIELSSMQRLCRQVEIAAWAREPAVSCLIATVRLQWRAISPVVFRSLEEALDPSYA